jgi:hypothetical protein
MKPAVPLNCLRGKIACAAACLSVFVTFQLFAALPKLHNWIHPDSDHASHHCELTVLLQGQVNATTNEGLVAAFISVVLPATLPARTAVVSFVHCQLPPGRAPPLA